MKGLEIAILNLASTGFLVGAIEWLSHYKVKNNFSRGHNKTLREVLR